MMNFFKSNIETVKERIKKPIIIASVLMVILIGVVISQGNFAQLMKRELFQTIVLYFMIGGVWYGRHMIANAGRAPIDENTGEEYYPGGFMGTMWRWGCALVIGATVGAVMFFIDFIKLVYAGIKRLVNREQKN